MSTKQKSRNETNKRSSSNDELLFGREDHIHKESFSVVRCIQENRELKNSYEASMASINLYGLLHLVEHAVQASDNLDDRSDILNGVGSAVEVCRLLSLRIDEYLERLHKEVA